MVELPALTALGAHDPVTVTVGPLTVTERFDVALASVAARRGRMADMSTAAATIPLPLPGAAQHQAGPIFSAFWVAPEMWFVEAPFASHEAIADMLKASLGETASITEQTDAWVALDLTAADLASVLERLCNVDFAVVPPAYATRTVIEHLGCYLIKHQPQAARVYGPRSSAASLLHALETAAAACG